MALYVDVSARIFDIYLKYISDEDIHVYSIDEVFMDITQYMKLYNMDAHTLVMTMIRDVLNNTGITATAVCPGPMDTDFIVKGRIKGFSKAFDTLPYCDPAKVARTALKATKKGRSVVTPTFFYKFYRLVAKLMPAKLMMKAAKT